MKKGILVVSFGSTHEDTISKAIAPLEQAVADSNPGMTCVRAFSSRMVVSRLKAKGYEVEGCEEALDRMVSEGFTDITVVPTLLIPGVEYDRLKALGEKYADKLHIEVKAPILNSDERIAQLAQIVKDAYPVDEDTALVGMGHGTEHEADAVYEKLSSAMAPAIVCTVEGSIDFEAAVKAVQASGKKKVMLVPMLIVAGDHAKNDMAGDEPDTLRSLMEAAGMEVTCQIKGLGELAGVQELFKATV